MRALDDLVDAWCARDGETALPGDRAVIDATRAARALVVEGLRVGTPDADLFNACAVLGRLFADFGGSPTLAASTMDGVRSVLPDLDEGTVRTARAALMEGFVAVRSEAARSAAAAQWEFPACAVPLEDSAVAIAGGFPGDDEDAVAAWAARVAAAAARNGYRRAIVAGGERACAALVDALELAGVKVRTTSPPAPLSQGRK
jgi:hypothetical protein